MNRWLNIRRGPDGCTTIVKRTPELALLGIGLFLSAGPVVGLLAWAFDSIVVGIVGVVVLMTLAAAFTWWRVDVTPAGVEVVYFACGYPLERRRFGLDVPVTAEWDWDGWDYVEIGYDEHDQVGLDAWHDADVAAEYIRDALARARAHAPIRGKGVYRRG